MSVLPPLPVPMSCLSLDECLKSTCLSIRICATTRSRIRIDLMRVYQDLPSTSLPSLHEETAIIALRPQPRSTTRIIAGSPSLRAKGNLHVHTMSARHRYPPCGPFAKLSQWNTENSRHEPYSVLYKSARPPSDSFSFEFRL